MRGIILSVLCIFAFIFANYIGISITDQASRSDELEASLEDCIEDTLEVMQETKEYSIHDINEYIKDFSETLSYETSSNAGVTVSLKSFNEEDGAATIEVKQHFMIATGKYKTMTKEISVNFEKFV